jgi:hypothetical protein
VKGVPVFDARFRAFPSSVAGLDEARMRLAPGNTPKEQAKGRAVPDGSPFGLGFGLRSATCNEPDYHDNYRDHQDNMD